MRAELACRLCDSLMRNRIPRTGEEMSPDSSGFLLEERKEPCSIILIRRDLCKVTPAMPTWGYPQTPPQAPVTEGGFS